jgi:hypothetical protein
MKTIKVVGTLVLSLTAAGTALAQSTGGAWLHVRVEEGAKQAKVNVNVPLGVVEALVKSAPESVQKHGRIKLGDHEGMKVDDARKAWQELKGVGDVDFVTIEDKDQKVRVSRVGNLVVVKVDGAPGKDQVSVEVPVDVVDALLSGEGDELNIAKALLVLQKRRGDIVRVVDKDSTVRVWIDERS